MARRTANGGCRPIFAALPFVFSLLSVTLAVIVLIAGSRTNILDGLSFFKVDTSNFDIKSKLSSSTYLQDLTEVSGIDLVGQDVTAESLGLARTYTISLLGYCSHHSDSTSCTSPRMGYFFDPITVLKLDTTAVANLDTSDIDEALARYERISQFLAFAYVASIAFAILGPILSLFGSKIRIIGFAGIFLSWLAAIILLVASGTGHYIYQHLSKAIDSDLDPIGIDSDFGLLLVPNQSSRRNPDLSFDTKHRSGAGGHVTGQANESAGPGSGLLNRVQTWGRQKYIGIGKQPGAERHSNRATPQGRGATSGDLSDDEQHLVPREQQDAYGSRRESLSFEPRAFPSRTSSDDGYGGQGDIAMMPLDNRGQKDLNTAYEPYSSRFF
ncbi:hypothetical protein BN1708_008634 [Verticillium longisporum]|uniref:Uncharacterized protein n=1 Tax=Verticillium longisporum TaxID=100787 RepID=A0A0G4N6T1_VERLO|nr:hypothetical protein BN1708_008634 [Verticillium longisporum]